MDDTWNLVTIFSGILCRYLSQGCALELLLMGDRISGKRGYEIGFGNRIVSKEKVMDVATELAEKLSANGPIGVRMAKELFYRGMELSRYQVMGLTWHLFSEASKLKDTEEGVKAFLGKKKPAIQRAVGRKQWINFWDT